MQFLYKVVQRHESLRPSGEVQTTARLEPDETETTVDAGEITITVTDQPAVVAALAPGSLLTVDINPAP